MLPSANASGADTVTCGVSAIEQHPLPYLRGPGRNGNSGPDGKFFCRPAHRCPCPPPLLPRMPSITFSLSSPTTITILLYGGAGLWRYRSVGGCSPGGDSAFSEDEVVLATGIQTATATASLARHLCQRDCGLGSVRDAADCHACLQPRGRKLHLGTVGIDQRCHTRRKHLLHHRRNHTDDRSAAYGGAITVPASETLEAIATAPSFSQSLWVRRRLPSARLAGRSRRFNTIAEATRPPPRLRFRSTTNITSGNLLLVAESSYNGVSLLPPTDTKGNTFTQLATAGSRFRTLARPRSTLPPPTPPEPIP